LLETVKHCKYLRKLNLCGIDTGTKSMFLEKLHAPENRTYCREELRILLNGGS
jgi:hypothetical protein